MSIRYKKGMTQQDLRLARRLQRLRRQANLTQGDLADRLGVDVSWVKRVENGYNRPNLKYLYKLARVLEIQVRDLFPF